MQNMQGVVVGLPSRAARALRALCGDVAVTRAQLTLRRVILESPYAGDIETNMAYARAALRDSLMRGEAPIASHLLYTQEGVLDDTIPNERRLGIDAGHAWLDVAEAVVFYVNLGMSPGMKAAWQRAQEAGVKCERRLEAIDEKLAT